MIEHELAPGYSAAPERRRWRWWHAAAFGLAVNALSGVMIGRGGGDRAFYEGMKLPRFAPPGWLFPPAWALNNVFTLWGNLRLLNLPPATPGRRAMMALQGASWILFPTFGFVYFRKRSPILAAVWTVADWLLTTATVAIAAKNRHNDIVGSQATKLAWLTLAMPVATYQAAHNPDPLFAGSPGASAPAESGRRSASPHTDAQR